LILNICSGFLSEILNEKTDLEYLISIY
jgi:hypothetical protein